MLVGIDFSRGVAKNRTGTEEYSYQLIRHLSSVRNSGIKFVLYIREGDFVDFPLGENFTIRPISGKLFWTQLRLSWELIKHPVDVLFIPSHTVPFFHPKNTVVTIHGLEFERCPDCYSFLNRIVLKINTKLSIFWSKKIIVPSQNTRDDLVNLYKVSSSKIEVINHGFVKNNLTGKYDKDCFKIFFIGRMERRKNIVGIIRSFDVFLKNLRKNNGGDVNKIKLIISGTKGYDFENIEKELKKSNFRDNIVLTGYIDEETKKESYRDSSLFLFPSFYEGFGFPVLEAMSFGVPVICSDNSSFREVASSAGIFVDPNNYNEIASNILKVFNDVKFREEKISLGFKNLERFSWKYCADKTFDILNNIKK